jgi:hypothetical protein
MLTDRKIIVMQELDRRGLIHGLGSGDGAVLGRSGRNSNYGRNGLDGRTSGIELFGDGVRPGFGVDVVLLGVDGRCGDGGGLFGGLSRGDGDGGCGVCSA